MSDIIVIQPQVSTVDVTEQVNSVVVSSVGVTGPAGATGATGSSGVVTVNAPITNSGTSTAANLSVSAGSTSAAGILQLTDSTSSTSTTTAATPNSVKSAYDVAITRSTMKLVSGVYYRQPTPSSGSITTLGTGSNRFTCIYVPSTTSFDRLAIRSGTSFSGTQTMRLGIYADTDGKPSTVILDAGTVSVSAANTNYEITISQSLNAGYYWLCMCTQGTAPATATYIGAPLGIAIVNPFMSAGASTPDANLNTGYQQDSVSGAFATATSLFLSAQPRYTWIRTA
jgi:hypothetical protein